MITYEKINNLYETIIFNKELTTQELKKCGFDSKDITKLIENNIIERIKRGSYNFIDAEGLFKYGKKLVSKKDYTKAQFCFEKCYKIDNKHPGTCFQLFFNSINKSDYDRALKYFEVIYQTNNPYYKSDSNLYLYLLNNITELNEEYKQIVKSLKMEDIRVDYNDKRFENITEQNRIRGAILTKKYPLALKQLNMLMENSNNIQNTLIRTLLYRVVEIEKARKQTMIDLINTENYYKLIELLNNQNEKIPLNITDEYTLKLLRDIIKIKERKKLPKTDLSLTDNLFEAIDKYNYKLALKISNDFCAEKGIYRENNTIHLLLTQINNLIDEIIKPTEIVETKKEIKILEQNPKDNNFNVNISDVINSLLENNLDKSFVLLKEYLKIINKTEYEFLIVNLIKICILEKDPTFTKAILILTVLNKPDFKIDLASYVHEFYKSLYQENYEVAKIFIDIIDNIGENTLSNNLTKILNNTIHKKTINIVQKDNTTSKTEMIDEKPKLNIVKKQKEEKNQLTNLDTREKFIENKYKEILKTKGIVLLKPMPYEKRKDVHELVKKYENIMSFSIGEGEKKRVVLKYHNPSNFGNIKEVVNRGYQLYQQAKYDECIDLYKVLLKSFPRPKAFVFANIGLSHLKNSQLTTAIDYLIVANELSKQEDMRYQFDGLLATLNVKSYATSEEIKKEFRMGLEEFENDEYYGINNFEEIIKFIVESNKTFEIACKEYGLNEEQIDIIKLICAKKYYQNNFIKRGEEFLNSVIHSKNKTDKTIKILNEIIRNKKIYCALNEQKDVFTLSLKLEKGYNK